VDRLHFPAYPFKLKRIAGHTQIYDRFRRKWLVLTPEEWVRQHVAVYLTHQGYPASLLALEYGLTLHRLKRRADLVAFKPDGTPFLLVECKAPSIEINQGTIDQAARYHLEIPAPYILITNGIKHYCIEFDHSGSWNYHDGVPVFPV